MMKMNKQNKKVSPKVKDGKVQKKNNWSVTSTYWNTPQKIPAIDKESPGRGYKHFLRKKDIVNFISILPEWDELSKGLNGILLARGDYWTDGIHHSVQGVIEICAWEKDMWRDFSVNGFTNHKEILGALAVDCEKRKGFYLAKFTESQIKGYQLLHVFLHELGHHHDKMTTKKQKLSSRGESYAEEYARKYEKIIWAKYLERFDLY